MGRSSLPSQPIVPVQPFLPVLPILPLLEVPPDAELDDASLDDRGRQLPRPAIGAEYVADSVSTASELNAL